MLARVSLNHRHVGMLLRLTSQQALEQQQKLAALKSWNHFSGFDVQSFGNIQDSVLYNVMWEMHPGDDSAYLSRGASPSKASPKDMLEDNDPDPTSSKAKKPRLSDPDSDSELSDIELKSDDDDDEEEATSSDDDYGESGDKRKRKMRSARASPSTSSRAKAGMVPANPRQPFGGVTSERKYSLHKIAEASSGRVMMVFERLAKSAMLDENGKKVDASREASVAPVQVDTDGNGER